jgi:selenocysteine lyase/cysteine desulfurase
VASELQKLDGVTLLTNPEANTSAAIIVFKPGVLDPRKFVATLYEKERVVVAAGGNSTHPGVRVSPHFYNTLDEVDRTIGAIRKYLATGV